MTDDAITTREAQHVSTTAKHPHLDLADPESVRRFFNLYYQYVEEVKARARKLGDGITTEAANPVEIKFCVDVDVLNSTIALGLIDVVDEYDNLTDAKLRTYLDEDS